MTARHFGIRRIAAVVLLAMLPMSTITAAEPAGRPPEPSVLAMLDALLKICAPRQGVDRTLAAMKAQLKELSKGVSDGAIAQVRAGEDYHVAYGSFTESFGTLDDQALQETCSGQSADKP
jgi:hypothetical protein